MASRFTEGIIKWNHGYLRPCTIGFVSQNPTHEYPMVITPKKFMVYQLPSGKLT